MGLENDTRVSLIMSSVVLSKKCPVCQIDPNENQGQNMKRIISALEKTTIAVNYGHWNILKGCGHSMCLICTFDFLKSLSKQKCSKGCSFMGCGYEYTWGSEKSSNAYRWNQLVTPFRHPTEEVTDSS